MQEQELSQPGTELSEEERAKAEREQQLAKIASLAGVLVKSRDLAIEARQTSGIEEDWLEDEEFYEGIDDANRDLVRNRAKPQSPDGGSDRLINKQDVRSRVFLNITRPYVDAAAAKVADMLLPTDDQNWGIEPTPIPTLVKKKDDQTPVVDPVSMNPMMVQGVGPDGQPMMDPETNQPIMRQKTVADQVKEVLDQAKQAAKDAETRIDDWLSESNYNNETRKCIEFTARLGTGIMKGPYPVERKRSAINRDGGLITMVNESYLGPESRAISPWNIYPDPNCGNNIHNGTHIWEKDKITARQLNELMNDETYIAENIQQCLREGPQKKYVADNAPDAQINLDEKDLFDIWFWHGFLGREEMEAMGCECDEFDLVPAIVTLVNDVPIKAVPNPSESGDFPYDVMTWQARDDYWAGIGVARQIRTPQRMLNGAIRQVMDNAGLSAGPQLVIRKGVVEPENGQWKLEPRKIWVMQEESEGKVQDAFAAINIQSLQAELMGIVQFSIKMAEDVTGLPMLLQGQQGKAPETVGGMQMLNNNASTVLRRIARTFDDSITEPHIRRYYEWLLLDPDVPSQEKGDFKIVARGSSALVERDIENQAIAEMGAIVTNPVFGINPKKWFAEHCKSRRLDPNTFQYTEEEQAKIDESMAQQKDPAVMVAELRYKETMEKVNLELQDKQAEREFKLQLAHIEENIAMIRLAEEKNMSISKIKAELARTAMTEKNKRDLQTQEIAVKKTQGSGI